jgi:hypothetical protein
MKNHLVMSVLALANLVSGCGWLDVFDVKSNLFEQWNARNDPLRLNGSYVRIFSQLPLKSELRQAPWADTYWASVEGGVAYRWQTYETPFRYAVHTREEVRAMTDEQRGKLSPAEKYDIFMGRYDFPTVVSERARTSPNDLSWEGLCHGWAAAAYLFSEPKPVVLQTGDGLKIPFGSSDVKALLTHYLGVIRPSPTRFLGTRCNIDLSNHGAPIPDECRDVNAGAFHVVLSNQIGVLGRSFVADVQRDREVWNQPVFGFESQIVSENNSASPGASPGTVKEIVLKTTMSYVSEISASWSDTSSFWSDTIQRETYDYRLELNSAGAIIGGEWISYNRPDFLWDMNRVTFSERFQALKNIYLSSISRPTESVASLNPTGRYFDLGPVASDVTLDGRREFSHEELIALSGRAHDSALVKRVFLWQDEVLVASSYTVVPEGTFVLQFRMNPGTHRLRLTGESRSGQSTDLGEVAIKVM